MTDWKLIGHVAVDSGQLLLCDPCYIHSQWERMEYDKENLTKTLSYNGCCHATMSEQRCGELLFPLGHPGAGICFESGIGDGLYPVYAKYEGVRIAEVKVVMLPHPTLGTQEEAFAFLKRKEGD